MKTVVYFAVSPNETYQAIVYKNQHPQETVKIFAIDLENQNILRNNKLSVNDFYIKDYYQNDFFKGYLWQLEKNMLKLTKNISGLLIDQIPEYKNLFITLQDRFELTYMEILDANNYYQNIEKKYHPTQYIAHKHINIKTNIYSPYASQIDLMSNFLINKNKIQIIPNINTKIVPSLKNNYTNYLKNIFIYLQYLDIIRDKFLARYNLNEQIKNISYDILFFSSGRNLNYYHRVIKILKDKYPEIKILILVNKQTIYDEKILKQNNISFIDISNLFNSKINTLIEFQSQKFTKIFNQQYSKIKFKKLLNKYPRNIKHAILIKTKETIINNFKEAIKYEILSKSVLDLFKPKLLITTHDPGPSVLPFVLEAKKRNISTLLFTHGWMGNITGLNYKSDFVTVWSKHIKNWYIKSLKKNASSLFALGYPILDDIYHQKLAFWQKPTEKKQIQYPIRLSLLLTIYLPHTALLTKFIEELFTVLMPLNNKFCINIRTHPGQIIHGLKELAKHYDLKVNINPNVTLEKYILNSDIILSWDTTAIVWCMLYGKPIFYCAPNWLPGIFHIEKFGGAWLVKDANDLREKIEKYITKPDMLKDLHYQQRVFLNKVIGFSTGNSSIKHVQLILKILKKHKLKQKR